MYAELEQLEKQYYVLMSAVHTLLDANELQHRRSRNIYTKPSTGSREVKPGPQQQPRAITTNIGCSSKYEKIRHIEQHFWNYFSTEYITLLKQRYKCKKCSDHLQVGTLVVIKDEALPPLLWHLGRITIEGIRATVRDEVPRCGSLSLFAIKPPSFFKHF
ncbi:hypothetical protein EVAR_14278_1 [Eumeta japonica]|uniref:DUF5641 domain-containing protein n=1 Tax=Eumeta variegata TaxID=151549 RepID=A0A4C1UMY7_EUMVA|nr:hypothetical protein EVAR_14278_1 [Eumeta japonica]